MKEINDALLEQSIDYVEGLSDAEYEDLIDAFEKEQPDFFCFSMVQYISGIQMDLDFLRDLKKRFPKMLLIADATQYVGSEEFRFRESGIDITIASCYKWLQAGGGNGFICVKEEVQKHIFAKEIGVGSAQNALVSNEVFMSRFEPGHQDIIAFGSLQQAILKVHEMGWGKIATPIKELAAMARAAFEKRNLLSPVVCSRKQHSSIFNIKGDQELYDKLLYPYFFGGEGIRVSFSYFNTERTWIDC